jgi:hypothetical protein
MYNRLAFRLFIPESYMMPKWKAENFYAYQILFYLNLVQKLKMSGAIPQLPHAPLWRAEGRLKTLLPTSKLQE